MCFVTPPEVVPRLLCNSLNSPDLNHLDFHIWGAMLEKYQAYTPKPTNMMEMKIVHESNLERLTTRAH